jgi:hypothetical protein
MNGIGRICPACQGEWWTCRVCDGEGEVVPASQLQEAVDVIADMLPAWLNGWNPGKNQDIIDRADALLRDRG